MKHLLLPIDGSRRSKYTIEIVKGMYAPDDAEISILMVVPNAAVGSLREAYRVKEVNELQQKAREILEKLPENLAGYQVKTVLRHGDPGEEIVHEARENQYDAVFMTRSSRGPIRKLGSVTNYVVKTATDQNVFVLREPEY